jgi:hypothetical protein
MLEGLTPPKRNTTGCKVGAIAATLTEADKEILLTAVTDKENWPVKTLSKALAERGIQISDSPIYNHRSRACACFRD